MRKGLEAETGPVIRAVASIALRNAPLVAGVVVASAVFLALDPPEAASWAVPILFFIGLWLLLYGLRQRADLIALRRGDRPVGGAYVAVCGRTVALDGPAPKDETLAWRFKSYRHVRSRTGSGGRRSVLSLRYDGFHLVPTGIETAGGTVRLAGFPDLIDRDKETIANDLVVRAKTSAVSYPRWVFPMLAREWAVYPGSDRIDLTIVYREDEEEGPSGTIECWIMRAGEDVCVCGRWRDGALCPDRWRPRGLPVYLGTPEEVEQGLAGEAKVLLYAGGGTLALAAGLAVWSLV